MLNFTVGPVQMHQEIMNIGAQQIPYFRTPEFSQVMMENERIVCSFAKAPKNSRAVFLTGSGTASMEAVVMNCLSKDDKVLVIEGGGFGQRFVELCKCHDVICTSLHIEPGKTLHEEDLVPYEGKGYTAFLVNIHETSTGVYYNPILISEFCKRNNLFLVVDAISSFFADEFEMDEWGVNVMITGSQKALAVPPGISIIIMDEVAQRRANENQSKCMYFDLKNALKNGERGQTPFTPAVGILLQINERLRMIVKAGGYESENRKIADLAQDFRKKMLEAELPFEFFSESMSNAVTALKTSGNTNAYTVFEILKDQYGIWVCPNGGELGKKIFRVGHIGALTKKDNDTLIEAMKNMQERGLLQ